MPKGSKRGKGNKFAPSHPEKKGGNFQIKPTQAQDGLLSFSFKFLDMKHSKFCFQNCDQSYFDTLLMRMKDLSGYKKGELVSNMTLRKTLKHHQIDFHAKNCSEDGFGLSDDFDDDAWQFSLTKNKHGRVHGFYIGTVFHVRWLDPTHDLYP